MPIEITYSNNDNLVPRKLDDALRCVIWEEYINRLQNVTNSTGDELLSVDIPSNSMELEK